MAAKFAILIGESNSSAKDRARGSLSTKASTISVAQRFPAGMSPMACDASSQLMRSASNSVRRARPSLGTFVEITARGDDEAKLHGAVDRAFDAIARVDRQMSFHHSASDVSRINREALQRKVTVDPWTWHVLRAAQELSHESDGIFDITVARKVMQWKYLP